MADVLLATVSGLFVGILFSALKLPIPAPHFFPGIMGIVGIYLGMHVYQQIIRLFFS